MEKRLIAIIEDRFVLVVLGETVFLHVLLLFIDSLCTACPSRDPQKPYFGV